MNLPNLQSKPVTSLKFQTFLGIEQKAEGGEVGEASAGASWNIAPSVWSSGQGSREHLGVCRQLLFPTEGGLLCDQ